MMFAASVSVFLFTVITYIIYKLYFLESNSCSVHEGVCTKMAITSKECVVLLAELKSLKPKVVGFDIEWSSKIEDRNKKISMIQLGHKNIIILLRMNLINNVPLELHDFLGDVEILKAGIGIHSDKNKLKNHYNLDVNGCVDINDIFDNLLSIKEQNELKCIYYKKDINDLTTQELHNSFGLASMSLLLLKQKMKYKNINKRHFHENWNDNQLTIHHIHYAADDALVGYKLFVKLMRNKNIKYNNEIINPYLEACIGLIDTKKAKSNKRNRKKKKIKEKKKKKNSMDDMKEMKMENCVVCGKTYMLSTLVKYYIVPTKYIRYLNKNEFELSNNVILTCKPCKKLCILNENNFGEYLCKEYDVKHVVDRRTFIKIRTATNGLMDNEIRYKLPVNIQINMLKDICSFFNLFYEIIYQEKEEKEEEKEQEEYKWQWYNTEIKQFADYFEDISNQIEKEYITNAKTMEFKIENTKKGIVNIYNVDFISMEQQNIKSRYKRGMRRIYKNDINKMRQYALNEFDHLINIVNYNNCLVPITTNTIINQCICEIIAQKHESVSSLRREQFDIHSRQLLQIFKEQKEFTDLWQQNFTKNLKPKQFINASL